MTLVGRRRLDQFVLKHPDTRSWIENWISDVQNANWENTQNIKDRYSQASFLANKIVIFNTNNKILILHTPRQINRISN